MLVTATRIMASAQRLSASTERTHGIGRGRRSHASDVLNAFRHQRNGHTGDRSRAIGAVDVCSTPFGINGSDHTGRARPYGRCSVSAQRLSASTERTHRCARRRAREQCRCSTPFGINGTDTRRSVACSDPIGECSTPFGINGTDTLATAVHPMRAAACAQRLSASTERTHAAELHGIPRSIECSTPFGINGTDTRRDRCSARQLAMCSTPFGINGTDTRRPSDSTLDGRRCAQRLSASTERTHSVAAARRCRSVECSTPFGINGTDTLPHRSPGRTLASSAQRLSASTERAHCTATRARVSARSVLNAFRHHRDGTRCDLRTLTAASRSAQRLSASQRWA